MANRVHFLERNPLSQISRNRCGWYRGFRLTERDEALGRRYSMRHRNVSGAMLDTRWSHRWDEVSCRRCLRVREQPSTYNLSTTTIAFDVGSSTASNITLYNWTGSTLAVVEPWPTWVSTTSDTTDTFANPWATWTQLTYGQDNGTALWGNWITANPAPLMIAALPQPRVQVGHGRQWGQENEEEYQRALLERREAMRTAQEAAEKLLVEHVSPVQREMWETEGRMVCRGTDGRRYGIRRGRLHNVRQLTPDGKVEAELCCLPSGGIPQSDVILGQLLHLQYNTEEFRRTANITQLRGRDRDEDWPPEDENLRLSAPQSVN